MFFDILYHFSSQQNILALIKGNDISKTLILENIVEKYPKFLSKVSIAQLSIFHREKANLLGLLRC